MNEITLRERVQAKLHERRENLLNGRFNSIPSPFITFREDFVGLEQSTYLAVTSYTKGGKTQFTLNLLFEALMFAYEHQDAIKLKIFYFVLEETDERILERFESWLLYRLDNIIVSPKDLRSTYNDRPISEDILNLLESEKYVEYINFFESIFIFSSTSNPTGIYKECRKYAEENGTVYKKKYATKDDIGNSIELEQFDYYTPNNPDEYRIIVIDHISLIDSERGISKKESIDKLSEYLAKYLRNRYHFTPIVIQQQSTENESNDSIKLNKIRPSGAGLSDSKYVQRDVNILLGLFSPFKFGLKEYLGYDISKFKDSIRFLEVCVNRDGELGGIIALYFNGATCTFRELPPPEDTKSLEEVYEYLDSINPRKKAKLFFIKTLQKVFKNNG